MARKPGRDKLVATRRLIRLLSLLAQVSPNWKLRDLMITELEYRDARPKDSIARDIRRLRERGWAIETRGSGTTMAHRLLDQDPRLNTLLTPGERLQLSRAVVLSGNDPADFGLAAHATVSPRAPIAPALTSAHIVEEALHAMKHQCPLHFTYKDRPRTVDVDDVRRTDAGRWRIVAREDGVQKFFRLDRISDVRLGPPGSASPPQPVTKDPDPLSIPDGEPIVAEVITDITHEPRVTLALGTPRHRTETAQGIELSIPVTNRWLWRRRLYQLGTRVQLVGPPELCDEVRAELLTFVEEPA